MWWALTWIVILSYGIERSATTWAFSIIGLIVTLRYLPRSSASRRQGPNNEVYKGCGNARAFNCINWVLVAIYGVGFVISLLSLPFNPAYHEVRLELRLLFGLWPHRAVLGEAARRGPRAAAAAPRRRGARGRAPVVEVPPGWRDDGRGLE